MFKKKIYSNKNIINRFNPSIIIDFNLIDKIMWFDL